MDSTIQSGIIAGCIAIDFLLVGNAITQSFLTLPSLIEDFPPQSSPKYAERAALLGRQWPVCWRAGNNFFRPISTLSTLGYAVSAWSLSRASSNTSRDWRFFALGALLHVSVIVHSAVNMQPLNDKLAKLAGLSTDGKDKVKADTSDALGLADKWIRWNLYRVAVPLLSGGISLWQYISV